jgi:phosphonate transport system permease protein
MYIDGRLGLLEYPTAAAGIVAVIFIVLSIELVSSRIRAYLRPGEQQKRGFVGALQDFFNPKKWLGVGR